MDFESTLNDLRVFFAQKNFAEAERLALQLIQNYPNQAAGYNALTTIYAGTGRKTLAKINAEKAYFEFKGDLNAATNFAKMMEEFGDLNRAVEVYVAASEVVPSVHIFKRLAHLHTIQKDYFAATKYFKLVVERDPTDVQSWIGMIEADVANYEFEHALELCSEVEKRFGKSDELQCIKGVTLMELGQSDSADDIFIQLLESNPTFGVAWLNRGVLYENRGDLEFADHCYAKSLQFNPEESLGYVNRSNVLIKRGQKEQALHLLRLAVSKGFNCFEIYYLLGILEHESGEFDQALLAHQKAYDINSSDPELLNNLAITHKYLGDYDKAAFFLRQAIALRPDYPEAKYNLGLVLWASQRFPEAFQLYENRFDALDTIGARHQIAKPLWSGDRERVLVWREQGIGDEILFCSTLPELSARVSKLVVEVDKRLLSIFERSFDRSIEFVSDRNLIDPNEYDSHIAMGSQFGFFRQSLGDFSVTSSGYLKADSVGQSRFKMQVRRSCESLLVGISWTTKSIQSFASFREIALDKLVEALDIPGIQLVNLQYGIDEEELFASTRKLGVDVLTIQNLDLTNDIEGLASLVSSLDLVVSIDNVTVTLAGALGVEAKALIPFVSCPRWSRAGNTSFLHDSVSLYRQKVPRSWVAELSQLRSDLLRELARN